MKAITVQQPWAWAIIHGGKDIENRTRIGTWRPARDSRIAIHAGQRLSTRGVEHEMLTERAEQAVDAGDADPDAVAICFGRWIDLTYGSIIGTVLVEDLHLDAGCCQPWGEPSYVEAGGTKRTDIVHLALADPRAVEPIECRGALGLWTVPADVAAVLA